MDFFFYREFDEGKDCDEEEVGVVEFVVVEYLVLVLGMVGDV